MARVLQRAQQPLHPVPELAEELRAGEQLEGSRSPHENQFPHEGLPDPRLLRHTAPRVSGKASKIRLGCFRDYRRRQQQQK